MQKTKKPLWLTAALAAFLVAVAVAGCKHDEEDEWTPLTIRGTVLEKYAGQRKSVTIPDGVTGIGSRAFSGSDVAEVVIPSFVTSIAAGAFSDSKVESVSYIGSQENWQKLVGNGLPDGIQVACFIIENDILIRYEGDETDVVIPAGFVKGIADGVFRDCAVRTGITRVTIPGSVKRIGENAFAGCTALADVRIEAGVADIGAGAFAGCTALESLNIPAGVTGLGERIVSGCARLTELFVHESVTTIAADAFTGIGRKEIVYRAKKAKWEKLVADTGIRQNLAGFTVHCTDGDWNGPAQGATTPGDEGDKKDPNTGEENPPHTHDWGGCTNNENGTHTKTCEICEHSVTEKHKYVNKECECGSKLELAGGTIDENGVLVSYDKREEKNVVIPDGVTGIGSNAFQDCYGLETVEIPESVTSIGGSAFAGCHGLTEVRIPGSVDTIGQGAFQNCSHLTKVTIENGVKNIETNAFEGCVGLTEMTIPGSVDTIGKGAFQKCSELKKVTIENGVKVVGNEAFQGCTNLTDVTIPDSVTSIGDNAFAGCPGITDITISKNVTSIGNDALACGNLKNITFTGTVAEWLKLSKDSGVGDNVTVKCTDGTVPWDITEDKTLRHYYGRETDVQIPWDSVESIGKAAFAATGVTTVTITQGVKHIDDGAFQGCGSLTHVEIPMSVTIIGYHAFYVCDKLETITFGGTRAQWGALTTANDIGIGNGVTVTCSDGTITTP